MPLMHCWGGGGITEGPCLGHSQEGVVREGGLEGSGSKEMRRTSSSSGATGKASWKHSLYVTAPHPVESPDL